MAIRYGDRNRVSTRIGEWLNGVPLPSGKVTETFGTIAVVADTSAHVKGAWVEAVASTSADATAIWISPNNALSASARQSLLDIGVGASGSEVVVVSNTVGGATSQTGWGGERGEYIYPVFIPAGSRVAFRIQSVAAGVTCSVIGSLLDFRFDSPASLVTFGAITATSRGTNMPTDDTYVQLVASTDQPFQGIVGVPLTATNNTATATVTYTIGIGASGSETVLDTFRVQTRNTEVGGYAPNQFPHVYFGNIPQGTRIAVKQSTGANFRDVILHGIPYA